MNFDSITREYLGEVQSLIEQADRTGAFTPELSYRSSLDGFLKAIAESIDSSIQVILEPKRKTGKGPDWLFLNRKTLGVYGHAEAKAPDPKKRMAAGIHDEQIQKYLDLGRQVILTDGLEFIFFSPKYQKPKRVFLTPKPIVVSDWKTLHPDPTLETQFRQFFKYAGFGRLSEEQLVEALARRAVELSHSIEDLSDLSPDSGESETQKKTIASLRELKAVVEEHHDPRLRNRKAFADFVAQVLVFGLLYAHRVIKGEKDTPIERYRKIRQFWHGLVYRQYTEHLRPFEALVSILHDELESDQSSLKAWYDDCCRLLAHIALDEDQMELPDYHKLYERFLTVFDPQTRLDFGAFYTPPELAGYAVELVKAIVASELKGTSLYTVNNKLIDPCCGTGTFLEELIKSANNPSKLPDIIGFEILPAPYALAHYRLSMLGVTPEYPHNLSVVLTNTLSDELEKEIAQKRSANLIEAEQAVARKLSQPPLTLVIGNPPSSDARINDLERGSYAIILKMLEDFRPPQEERTSRQNTQKQLQNDFVLFLRWSCNKLLESPQGILALVLPSSFAEHTSFLYARKWIASHFSNLWLLDLDSDVRTGKRASGLFKTLQGRLLLVGTTLQKSKSSGLKQFHYASIADLSREQKLATLKTKRDTAGYLGMFKNHSLNTHTFAFHPLRKYDEETYSRFWSLYEDGADTEERHLFERHCSGVKLAPTSLFVHPSAALLERRCRDVADESVAVNQLIEKWFSGQDRPVAVTKLSDDVRRGIAEVMSSPSVQDPVIPYAYRPMTTAFAFISESVLRTLSRKGGGGTRYRPEVLSAFRSKDVIGFAVAPAPKDIGGKLHRFVSFCWGLPDNDLCKRGNAQILCNRFPEYQTHAKQGEWDPTPINNVTPELLEAVKKFPAHLRKDFEDRVVFYAYAVLCSDVFLEAFEGVLFAVAGAQRPRIPIPANYGLFASIARKGERLAYLEKPSEKVALSSDLARFERSFGSEFDLGSYVIDVATEQIDLYDRDRRKSLSIGPIPRSLLDHTVSGYQVVQQWLKIHSWRYTRTTFTKEQFLEFLGLLNRIARQNEVIKALNRDVSKLISGEAPLL